MRPGSRRLGSQCTSADSGLHAPSPLPPSPAPALAAGARAAGSPGLLAQGQLEPKLLQALPRPPRLPGQVSSAGRCGAAAAGGAEALHHRSGRAGGRPGGASLPRSRPDGHLPAAARSPRGDRTRALIGAVSESPALFIQPLLHDSTSSELRAGARPEAAFSNGKEEDKPGPRTTWLRASLHGPFSRALLYRASTQRGA